MSKSLTLEEAIDLLRAEVKEKRYLEVGGGVEERLGLSRERFAFAVAALRKEGFERYYLRFTQHGSGKVATVKVLAVPGTTYKEVYEKRTHIQKAGA